MAGQGGFNRLGGPGQPALPGALGGARLSPFQVGLLLAALAIGGVVGYWGFTHFYESANQPPAVGQPVRVVRRTIVNTVSATGNVTATQQSNLTFQVSGPITQVLVKPGDQVQAGQPIATLDNRAAVIGRDTARSNLATAQAKLDALLAGATPDVVAAAQQAVAQAQAGTVTAQQAVTQAQTNTVTAQQAVSQAQANLATAQGTLTTAQGNLALLLAGATPTQIEQAQAAVDSANSNLQIAQANYDKLVSHSDLPTRTETTTLATARQNYQTAQANYLNKLTPPLALNVAQAQTNARLAQQALQTAQLRNLNVQSDPTSALSDKLAAQNQVAAAQAAVDQTQAALQLLQQPTDQTDIAAAKAQLDNARVGLQSAETNYNNLVALSDLATRPETSALSQAQGQLETAQANYNNTVAPPQQASVNNDVAAVQAAQAGIPSAQGALQAAQAGVPNAQGALQAAQAGVPSAQSALQAAQAKLAQTVGPPLPTDVRQATEAVTAAQLALQNAQLSLDNETLVAPYSGTIVSVPATVGTQVSPTTVIATLVNPNAIEVDANVDETSVVQLKIGQPATITLDALPGKTFNGRVAAVTPAGTTQQGVVVFPVVFTLDTGGQPVPAGASANITVTTQSTPNVLVVPSRYVHRAPTGGNVVDELVNNKRVSVPVVTGVTNGQLTQIVSGLQEGDVVIPPQQTRQGATFGAGGPGGPGGPPAP